MDYLPEPFTTFAQVVEADLRRAARLVIKVQDEIDPQFRFACPDGDYALAVTLSKDDGERRAMFRRISTLMVWKQANAFTLACELVEPDSVYCMGISRTQKLACMSRITRKPVPWTKANFGAVEWLNEAQLDQSMIDLLPFEPRPLTPKDVAAANKWFGADGKFPLVHLPSKEVRGV